MRRDRSLIGIVVWRVTIFAFVAMALEAIMVFVHYYTDDSKLMDLMIDREAHSLAAGFARADGGFGYELPEELQEYSASNGRFISRIRLPSGEVLFSNCDANCAKHLLPLDLDPPDAWQRMISKDKPIRAVGGRTVMIDGRKMFVEIGLLDDTDGVMWGAIGEELADHMIVPMTLMLLFTLGATLLSIRHALRPVADAAKAAEAMDPLDARSQLPVGGMPREAAEFVHAVNRSIARIGDVMRAQKLYTAAVAHEIRVPLAAIKLALARIADPQARKIDADIDQLAHFVSQMTALSRIESFDRRAFERIDLAKLGSQVVEDMAPLVFADNHKIGFRQERPETALGLAVLIQDAVRNLVENAVRHTPPGTSITVVAGPGTAIRVTDTAGIDSGAFQIEGAPGSFKPADRIGIGLEIVRRIVDLHRGQFRISVQPGRLTTAAITLPSYREADAGDA